MKVNINIPPAYIRGEGVLTQLGSFCKERAERVLIIGGQRALAAVKAEMIVSLEASGVEVVGVEWYGGECTWEHVERIAQMITEEQAGLLLAVGGGKALDTGKAAAYQADVPCVTVPTIAATCAAYTPLSIMYDDQSVYIENTPKSACPVGIFADTRVILEAPKKWLYAGMGDTLAKWYELRATTGNIPRTSWTIGGITNGQICYEIIEEFGPEAKKAIDNQEMNLGLEYVLDAIILYAGMSSILGGEKCRGAAAHSLYFGFTNTPLGHEVGHGLLVGFGNLVLLALEDRSDEEILGEIKLARDCGVPVNFKEIGEMTESDLEIIAKVAAEANDMQNMPMDVSPAMVLDAMHRIDKLGS